MIYLNEKFFTEIKKFRYEIINNQKIPKNKTVILKWRIKKLIK